MENQDGEITIYYGNESISIDLDDLNGEILSEAFNLTKTPLTLFHIDPISRNKKFTPIKKKEKFKVGNVYHIQKRSSVSPPSMYGGLLPGEIEVAKEGSKPSSAATKGQQDPWKWTSLHETVQNSVVLCRAVYAANDLEIYNYLMESLHDHNFRKILRSRHGRSHFVIAEEIDKDRVYIAFRGSHSNKDWHDNLHAYQEFAFKGMKGMQGKVHSGFLTRAMDFPIQKILNDSYILSKNIIFCGHSLGGAVATLAAIMTMIELKAQPNTNDNGCRWVKCITFGAPMVGDGVFKQFCQTNDLDRHIYNFVYDQDPIPRILSYSQLLSAMSAQLDNEIRKLSASCSTQEAENYFKEKRQTWINQKDQYVNILGKIIPVVEPALELAGLALPNYAGTLLLAKGLSKIIHDVIVSTQNEGTESQKVYTYLGNYMVLVQHDPRAPSFAQHYEETKIDLIMEMTLKHSLREAVQDVPIFHAIANYEEIIDKWAGCSGKFPKTIPYPVMAFEHSTVEYIPRRIEIVDTFKPEIISAELVRVHAHGKDYLRLRLTGRHLFEFIIEKCVFNFGYPFATNPAMFTSKKVFQTDNIETLIFEEEFREDPCVSDHGSTIKLVSKFGECEYLLRKEQIRNVKIPTLNETLSDHESLAILIKRAIQRGMSMAYLTRIHKPGKSTWKPNNERIIIEVKRLAAIALEKLDHDQLSDIFEDASSHNQFILSNAQEFEKVQRICEKIQIFLRSPLELTAEKTVLRKIGIGVAAFLGGVAFAYAAGPGLVVIGMMEATSMSAAGLAGSFGFFGAGFMTNYFFTSSATDKNYEIVLSWLTMELMNKLQKQSARTQDPEELKTLQEVSDLREDGNLFNLERALLKMYDPEIGTGNFVGCDIGNCTVDSQNLAIKRIECIQAIHEIRRLMAEQCYIGIVGMQDAGKTTLINKIWGVGGKTGHFNHTMVPVIYEVHKKVSVVDFPGSTSLDYHAKTFSICGMMNNLILVVVPYTGDMNELIAREISQVFSVMAGSESSKVVLCINKSGYELPKALKDEMKEYQDPMAMLKTKFVTTLNQYYESQESNFKISEENILFTDWMVGDRPEMQAMGIVGIDGVKDEIRKYLLRQKIFNEENSAELETCFSKADFSHA